MASTCSRGNSRSHAARLSCGTLLTYEAASLVPLVGEVVPCRRHGYCRVADTEHVADPTRRRRPRARKPRSQEELLDFLRRHPVTSLHRLRNSGFSLRMVTAAQQRGLVDVDVITGRTALRRVAAG